ncbi:MAG: hypothetical protein ACE5EX_01160 [Phycisphaerae bacterium]
MHRSSRFTRWLLVVGLAGLMPAVVMRCDKAALNFQRGLFLGLGAGAAGLLLNQASLGGTTTP